MILGLPPLVFAGLAAGGTALAKGLFLGYPAPRLESGLLGTKEQAVVAAFADTLFPAGGPTKLSGTEANLVEYIDDYVRRLPEEQAMLVRLLCWFIEHGPWIFGPRRVRFTSLPVADRLVVLERMRTSPIYFRRIAFLSMRTMLTMGYLAHPEVAKAMRMQADADPFGIGDRVYETVGGRSA